MTRKLQGLASRLGKFNHDNDTLADEVNSLLDSAEAKREVVRPRVKGHIEATVNELVDVHAVLDQLDTLSNGGPALDDQPTTPVPGVRGYPH